MKNLIRLTDYHQKDITDIFNMGKELGIPTPYNEYTYHIIKAMEERNDGKFDYSKDNGAMTCARKGKIMEV